MKIINWLCKQIVTLGPIGWLPAAGTCGTLAAIPLLFALNKILAKISFLSDKVIYFLLFFILLWLVQQALECFNGHDQDHNDDPGSIVIDEVFGFWITLIYMPLTVPVIAIGFVYFRLFDIFKPFGIAEAEYLPGAWGIMVDDLIAGIYAWFALVITLEVLVRFHVPLF